MRLDTKTGDSYETRMTRLVLRPRNAYTNLVGSFTLFLLAEGAQSAQGGVSNMHENGT